VPGFDPYREREVESWLTVANGETGTRGSLEEGSAVSTPATLVAGVFGDDTAEPHIRQPVPAPDWLGLRLKIGDTPLTVSNGQILDHHRVLDMRHGVVYRYWRQREAGGRTVNVRTARFASLDDRSLMALRAEAVPEDFSGRLIWEGAVGVTHAGGPVRETTFEPSDGPGFVVSTHGRNGGGHVLAVSTRPAAGSPVERTVDQARDVIGGRLEAGEPATVDRLAAIVSARTRLPSSEKALRALGRAERSGFEQLLERHKAAWAERWRDSDVTIEGDPVAQEALRFSIYHLIGTAHPEKDRVSVGARGLHGLSYFLHVFWDTEIFVLPFFIYSHPQTARTLLTYRYNLLDGAREKARAAGAQGRPLPLGVRRPRRGDDASVRHRARRRHRPDPVGSARAPHLRRCGLGRLGVLEGDGRRRVHGRDGRRAAARDGPLLGVAGGPRRRRPPPHQRGRRTRRVPRRRRRQRLHQRARRWNIRTAIVALRWLERRSLTDATELRARLRLAPKELEEWRRVADGLVDGFDPETKLYEQFKGFYELDDVPIERLRPRPMAADMLLGREVTLRSKVIKQADVVMLCWILSDEIPADVARANYEYYEPLTSHGSSLSPGMHAAVAAEFGDLALAEEAFAIARNIDLGNTMANVARGLHMATMGSLWQAAVMGFAGLRRLDEALVVDPTCRPRGGASRCPLWFRGSRAVFELEQLAEDRLSVGISVEHAPLTVLIDGVERRLEPGRHRWVRAGAVMGGGEVRLLVALSGDTRVRRAAAGRRHGARARPAAGRCRACTSENRPASPAPRASISRWSRPATSAERDRPPRGGRGGRADRRWACARSRRRASGGTAQAVLKELSRPLLLVRPGMRPIGELRRLLVPLEGSPSASEAMRYADEACARAAARS
jgi:trehalose/maltose hydrolase-like predicted phosphorylase